MKFPYNKVLEIQRRYRAGELPREEAKEQLAYVLDLNDDNDFCEEAAKGAEIVRMQSYGPLLRLSDVCNTFHTWANNFGKEPPAEDKPWVQEERKRFMEAFHTIDLFIDKSNFLGRLFFSGEGVRTVPCPEHKGRWSGCHFGEPCACQSGWNVTGWLATDPKFADLTYWDAEKKRYKTEEEIDVS